ncbi:hypothetical protein M9H77_11821 [Catharanthus roseus]|uniref:Uncharacterized protein n=1 Tax=Catharanthus roseus TaxID=4058 RepID=A0ACC0BFU5_CATRO|nr:hypothetical protein M9H77_11821 [Catharanthus roseus]
MDAHNFQPLHDVGESKILKVVSQLPKTLSMANFRAYHACFVWFFFLYGCTINSNYRHCDVMESFQSSNRTVPYSTMSSIGEPEPIYRIAPKCVKSYLALLNHWLLSHFCTMFSVTGLIGFTGFRGVWNSPSSRSLSSSDSD